MPLLGSLTGQPSPDPGQAHESASDRTNHGIEKARVMSFATLEEKASWLDAAASLDTSLLYVRKFAQQFKRFASNKPNCARIIHHWVRDNIHYVQDYRIIENLPGEEFADSEAVLRRGYDDCDGKARLFVCLCRLQGIASRIRPVFRRHPQLDFVHVQAEVRWPGSEREKNAEPGGWLLCELILKDCEIGENPDDVPRDKNGKRVLA
jgi:transglutaminase-like putative cysteine protease